jgi:predicted DNA-binding transcriptional regulator AlpA
MSENAEYLSHAQLAQKLALPLRTIRKWSYLRRLPGRVALGPRCVRYDRLTIERALNSGSLLLSTKGNKA